MILRAPLSFQQEWLLNLSGQFPDWNCVLDYAFRLHGPLQPEILESCLQHILNAHGSLRTRIVADQGTLWQEIQAPEPHKLSLVQFSDGTIWMQQFREQQLDPTAGVPLALALCRLDDGHYILALSVHRVIADCFSIEQVFRELWLAHARRYEQTPPQPTVTMPQYREYAARQRATYNHWLRKHGAYWNEHLAGASIPAWPVDTEARRDSGPLIGHIKSALSRELSELLHALAQSAKTLAAVVMLALYVAVLAKRCCQNDLVIPFNIAGRQSQQRNIVGYFSHIVYLRIRLKGDEAFTELMNLVATEFFRALTNQDFGLLATQRPELLLGTYFQWVSWHRAAPLTLRSTADGQPLIAEQLTTRDFGEGLTALPAGLVAVELTAFDTQEGVILRGVYRTDRFTAGTMQDLMTELSSAAERLVRNPHTSVAPI